MFKRILQFVKSEEGYSTEGLIWNVVLGIGAATLTIGLLSAERFQGGHINSDIGIIITPSNLPVGDEQLKMLRSGYTGAITGMVVGAP